jgi:hypothetical protein
MVIYDLVCKKKHRFEGWFPSFEDYTRQVERNQVSCPVCNTTKVEKLPHACAVHVKGKREEKPVEKRRRRRAPELSEAQVKELLIQLNHYVRENFEDVGSRFADEARGIFDGKTPNRPIRGTSTTEEREAMDEDGIPYLILPKPELDS